MENETFRANTVRFDGLDLRILGQAAGLGLVTGMRSMLGLRMLAASARDGAFDDRQGPFFKALRAPAALPLLTTLATGELLADKLPGVPSRLSAFPLSGRIALGALVGGLVGARGDKPGARILGALLGAAAAAAGAYAGNRARTWMSRHTSIAGPLAAVIEDGIAVSLGHASKPV